MSDDHAAAYVRESDGIVVFRASSIGACSTNLIASLRGETPLPPSDFLEEIFAEGWRLEDAAIANLDELGWDVTSQQEEFEIPVVAGKIIILGHIDGRVRHRQTGRQLLWETKGLGPTVFPKWDGRGPDALLADTRYAAQASAAIYALEYPMLYTVKERLKDPDTGQFRSDGRLYAFEVPGPPLSISAIKAKLVRIVAISQNEDEWPACDGGDVELWRCPFQYLHPARPAAAPAIHTPDLGPDLARAWLLNQLRDRIEQEYKQLRLSILAAMKSTGDTKIVASGVSGTHVTKTSRRLDTDKARRRLEQLGESLDEYEITRPIDELRLKGSDVPPGEVEEALRGLLRELSGGDSD